jgi:biotin transport system substrate-specific component
MKKDAEKRLKYITLSAIFAAATAVGSFIRIPIYPTVPFTLQTFFTVLAASILPPKWAAYSQLTYLLIGLIGFPVFVNGGGPSYIFRPTFGYLLALPIVAFIISSLNQNISLAGRILFHFLGLMLILLIGAMWLYISMNFIINQDFGLQKTFMTGFIVFLPTELSKAILTAIIAQEIYKRNLI